MEEQRYPGPPSLRRMARDEEIARPRFPDGLDQQARSLQRPAVDLYGPVLAVEGDLDAITLDGIGQPGRVQV
jgi:hypothetical protein